MFFDRFWCSGVGLVKLMVDETDFVFRSLSCSGARFGLLIFGLLPGA